MACEKHGYTNNTICPSCDADLVNKYTTKHAIQLARECGFELELFNSIDGYEVVVNGKIITDQLIRFYDLAQAQALRDASVRCDAIKQPWAADELRQMAEELEK